MLIDTHCHINLMVKKQFDTALSPEDIIAAKKITDEAEQANVTTIINVGTSIIESKNCIELAKKIKNNYAVIGIHPGDGTAHWKHDIQEVKTLLTTYNDFIVGIGECGLDYHYRNSNKNRQKDIFKAQIELALEKDLPLVIHTRDAADDTLSCLDEFKKEENLKGVFHCFCQDQAFAEYAMKELNFYIGIGGIITYPKNDPLRSLVKNIGIEHILLETDAPYLPPQTIRGKQNHPKEIKTIALFMAHLFDMSFESIAQKTTTNAQQLFSKCIR